MTVSEELEGIGRALPEASLLQLYETVLAVPPDAFSAVLGVLRAVPADALERVALPAATPDLSYLQIAVLGRAMRAVASSFEGFEQEELAKIAAEETDSEVLFEIVTHSRLLDVLEQKNPMAGLRLEGVEEQRRLIREAGGAVSAVEAGEILGGISRQAVDARRRKGRLLAVGIPGGRRGWRYPVCQFDGASEDGVVWGLGKVISVVEDPSGWMPLAFLLSPDERLGGERPLDVLKEGRVGEAERAALAYGEHVAY